ncbi:uncharacterized protein LOC144009238 isoform X3 [Festucalex cinctus]
MQSQREYKRDYEEHVKGKALVELEQTPEYLTARQATKLLNEKEYRKDLEREVKGRGLWGLGLEDTPELLRVKRANRILNPKEYRRAVDAEVLGKGMALSADVLEVRRVKRATRIHSQRAYKQTEHLRDNSYGSVSDTPQLVHASHLKDVYSQRKYKEEAERLRARYSAPSLTPEMERVKANQRHLSSMQYCWDAKLMRGLLSSVGETPEMLLARDNARNISHVRTHTHFPTVFGSGVASHCVVVQVRYRERVGRGTAVTDTPEMERVRRNQENISSVKYRRGLQELRGRSCTELDTPEYRRVRRSQDSLSMAKYHEDFERARAGGCTPSADSDESAGTERYRRDNRGAADAGPNHATDTDRRPGGIIVAPVLPGAYQQGAHMQPQPPYHGYMHQTSMSSVRSLTSPPHSSTTRVYRALYDYAAQDHDEVSFRDGDVIVNAQPIDEGWMYGTVRRTGKSGMLPANYMECCN